MGKVFGAMLGAGVGLIFGSALAAGVLAFVGVWVGHRWDALHGSSPVLAHERAAFHEPLPEPQTRAEIEAAARAQFARHLVTLFAAVAKADGDAVAEEVRIVRRYFERDLLFSAVELEAVAAVVKEVLATPPDLREAARTCLEQLPASERAALFSALCALALSDGPMNPRERETLADLAERLAVPALERRRILNLELSSAQATYAVLEVSPEASDEQVKSSFRRLAALHHPDKLAHLGPTAVQTASARFRELRDAYDRIRALRGF